MVRFWHLSAGGALILAAAGLALGLPATGPRPVIRAMADAEDPVQVARGEQVYKSRCAGCHGDRLQGEFGWTIPAPDGRVKAPPLGPGGHTHEHSDSNLAEIIKSGLGVSEFMPRFGPILGDDEVYSVMAYIKSSWPLALRIAQAAANPDRAGMPAAVNNPAAAKAETCVTTRRPFSRPLLPPSP